MKDLDRKRLWGRAGSRCAVCNRELTAEFGIDSIVGDEAHIRSSSPEGPRHDPGYSAGLLDSYENRVLLCKVHHKLVDDNADVFTTKAVEGLKQRHEARVARLLSGAAGQWTQAPVLDVIADGTELASLASGALAYLLGNDHPRRRDDAALIGRFLQSFQDWGDLLPDVGAQGVIDAAMDLDEQMADLAAAGYEVVGGRGRYAIARDLEVVAAVVRVVIPSE